MKISLLKLYKKLQTKNLKDIKLSVKRKFKHHFFKYLYKFIKSKESIYKPPSKKDLLKIEKELIKNGIEIFDYYINLKEFEAFEQKSWFPIDYHGGINSSVWKEKILEHWLAYKFLNLNEWLPHEKYIDVAAANSPWALELRKNLDIKAYAIDLQKPTEKFADYDFYMQQNAVKTSFKGNSIKGISLQCAYEMFEGDDDFNFIKELNRILCVGGKAIILPLYMHTHYCCYSSPEYYGKNYSPTEAKEYITYEVRGIRSSRKYDVAALKIRILNQIESLDMRYKIHKLKNKNKINNLIYCHFILEIIK